MLNVSWPDLVGLTCQLTNLLMGLIRLPYRPTRQKQKYLAFSGLLPTFCMNLYQSNSGFNEHLFMKAALCLAWGWSKTALEIRSGGLNGLVDFFSEESRGGRINFLPLYAYINFMPSVEFKKIFKAYR